VRDALRNANARKRLTQAALDFLEVRADGARARPVGDSA